MKGKLERDPNHRWIAGVCGGLGNFFGINPLVFRGLFILFVPGYGVGIIVYIILIFVMPQKREGSLPTVKVVDSVQAASFTSQPSVTPKAPARLLDLNQASEQELATLPGLTSLQVKQLVKTRTEKGGFRSLEEVAQLLSLKPHVVEQLRPLLQFGSVAQRGQETSSGRRVDI
jgi:phage shock protein PspC (stress-responsive transcriptional regulator)